MVCTKNLPENDSVFFGGRAAGCNGGPGAPAMGANLLNSPYEAAKRLARESASLEATSQRFIEYLLGMDQLVTEAEGLVITSYQSEYKKLETIAEIMTHMIND